MVFNNIKVKTKLVSSIEDSKILDGDVISITFKDRIGKEVDFHIEKKDILIIGSDFESMNELAERIIRSFEQNQEEISIVDSHAISKDCFNRSENVIYIIMIDSKNLKLSNVFNLLISCPTKILFKMKKLNLLCGLNGKVESDYKTDRLLNLCGGNVDVNRYLVSSLQKKEFVIITKDNAKLCCL